MGERKRDVLTVFGRGQITLPAGMRQHLGIIPGSVLIISVMRCSSGSVAGDATVVR